jgi:sulfur carrier protein ThiS
MIRVGDKTYPWHDGLTVADLLEMIEDAKDCAVVRLNNKLVSKPNFETSLVPDNAEIILIPMIAGG